MNSRAVAGVAAGALVVGLLVGLSIGGGDNKPSKEAGPGATKLVAGVPVGSERSEAGALAAAVTYFRVLAETVGQGGKARDRVLDAITLPERRMAIVDAKAAETLEAIEAELAGRKPFSRSGVLGQRLMTYGDDEAEVRLWGVSVLAATNAQARAVWGSGTIELRWRNGDWKLWSAPPGSDGPTPALLGSATPTDEFLAGVQQLEPIR